MREGEIPFPVRERLFIKGAGMEVLLPDPLAFPCHVEEIYFAKNKGRSHRW